MIVDHLSKYAHFIPLKHPYIAAGVAHSFFDIVFKLHSLPSVAVGDRDHAFTSTFWEEIF